MQQPTPAWSCRFCDPCICGCIVFDWLILSGVALACRHLAIEWGIRAQAFKRSSFWARQLQPSSPTINIRANGRSGIVQFCH